MGKNLILGRYIPIESPIHRLDPRAKMLATVLYLIIVFFANNWLTYLILFLFVAAGITLSNIPWGYFLRGVRPLLGLILFTVALQVLFTPGQTTLFSWGILEVSREGLINGVFIFFRFVLIIFMSTLLTLTTEPIALTDAIEFYLSPFSKLGFPSHEIALMLSIALRFVPTLLDETEKIMNAQRARGMDFSEGNLLDRMKNVVPLLVPLFISSFDRALDLATAMEARGYRGGENRTRYRILKWNRRDTYLIGSFIVLYILIFILRN